MNWYKNIKTAQNPPELEAFLQKWRNMGITLYIYEKDNLILLDSIIVPRDMRKQGIGTQIMNELTDYADRVGKRIELTPALKDPYHGTTSRKRLIDFYKRFGLIENKGRNKDFTTTRSMYADPHEFT